MPKNFFWILLAAFALYGQDITASDSTIQIYNNSLMSFADGVLFTSHSPTPIHLDSAMVHVDTMDTSGLKGARIQLAWKNEDQTQARFVWRMDSIAPKDYRLTKVAFSPPASQPLAFSGSDSTEAIFMIEIGFRFQCELFPTYVRMFMGNLKLFFSNGQTITLQLTANDLNAGVKRMQEKRSLVIGKSGNKRVRCLVNGRKVGDDNMQQNGKMARIRVMEKQE